VKLNYKATISGIKLIDEIPGVGFIIAATIVAILETPIGCGIKGKCGLMPGWESIKSLRQ